MLETDVALALEWRMAISHRETLQRIKTAGPMWHLMLLVTDPYFTPVEVLLLSWTMTARTKLFKIPSRDHLFYPASGVHDDGAKKMLAFIQDAFSAKTKQIKQREFYLHVLKYSYHLQEVFTDTSIYRNAKRATCMGMVGKVARIILLLSTRSVPAISCHSLSIAARFLFRCHMHRVSIRLYRSFLTSCAPSY